MGGKRLEERAREQWDKLYRNEGIPKPVQMDMPSIVDFFRSHDVNSILDLACGSGRHTVYLAGQGFEVYGLDISEEGIKYAELWLNKERLHAQLAVGSMYEKLPYRDSSFDAIVCIRALNHGTIEDISGAINEMERVLKPGGFVYVTLRKRISKEKRLMHETVAPRTYIPLEGKEKGVVHYLFNKELLRRSFGNFKIHELRIDKGPEEWEAYYVLLGELTN